MSGNVDRDCVVPDIQYFAETGTWHKPSRAGRIDALIKVGSDGAAPGHDGEDAAGLHVWSRMADDLPDTVKVEISKGSYAVFITHLRGAGR